MKWNFPFPDVYMLIKMAAADNKKQARKANFTYFDEFTAYVFKT